MLGHVRRQAHVDAAVGERQRHPGGADEGSRPAAANVLGGVHLRRVGFDTDVVPARLVERRGEVARSAADVDHGVSGRPVGVARSPQVGDHRGGVGGQCAVEPVRVALFVAELGEQACRPAQRCAPGEQVGDAHRFTLVTAARLNPMSATVRSVLLLCWRDTGHPQGGGSETYLQRIGALLAESGVDVTLRTARYPGAPRREVVDGVTVSRGGGHYTVYIWAGLAMVLRPHRAGSAATGAPRRGGRHPERSAVPGAPGVRPAGGGAGAPLPSSAVAGRRPVRGPAGLAGRVVAVAADASAQPVRDGVAAVGPRPGRPRRRRRPHRRGPQRPGRGAHRDAER